jgi:hypothetical protein
LYHAKESKPAWNWWFAVCENQWDNAKNMTGCVNGGTK